MLFCLCMQTFDLFDCRLPGTLPDSWSALTSLQVGLLVDSAALMPVQQRSAEPQCTMALRLCIVAVHG
jgi:hypothetical protein